MKSVQTHKFAMVPRAEIPRSGFNMPRAYKTAFNAGYLVPVLCEEVLPGDTWRVNMHAFARLATPIFPVMDNMHLDSFFFFCPNRLVWDNWVRFMGEQDDPGDSTDFEIPQCPGPNGGYPIGSLFDYFGLPTEGQVDPALSVSASVLPLRMYNLIWNQWFRDENLQDSLQVKRDDGPDSDTLYSLKRRGKRPDYFTTCLPWPQKGGTSVTIPLGTSAPVITTAGHQLFGAQNPLFLKEASTGNTPTGSRGLSTSLGGGSFGTNASADIMTGDQIYPSNLVADLSEASAATINQLRMSFQVQKLLERDARGGTRYTELIRAHFGVISPDARLQRPEYLGGGSTPVTITPIVQTSGTGISEQETPQGNLAAIGTVSARNGFSQSFTEHGYIIGLVSVRADLTYQQGLRRHWSRLTREEFYFPAFAMLGEQAVLQKEIFCSGDPADEDVFGYQERWAEYRYSPSEITGIFRSTAAGSLDGWHLAQVFATAPGLGDSFIQDTPPVDRILAVPSATPDSWQFIFDSVFDMRVARAMPMYSVPGLIDHF